MGIMITRNLRSIQWREWGPLVEGPELGSNVDVWWLVDEGGLALLVPHIMSQHTFWKENTGWGASKCYVRLFVVSREAPEVDEEDDGTINLKKRESELLKTAGDNYRARQLGVVGTDKAEDLWKAEIMEL